MIDVKRLIQLSATTPINLSYGAMGLCIYLAELNDKRWINVYSQIKQRLVDLDTDMSLKTGLSGIALSIIELCKKDFIKEQVSDILNDIDNLLYRIIAYEEQGSQDLTVEIDVLYYLIIRYEYCRSKNERLIYRKLVMQKVNDVLFLITPESFLEPLKYSLDFVLPKILYVFSLVIEMDICTERIVKMLNTMSSMILYKIPLLDSNKLYLLFGLTKIINSCNGFQDWKQYRTLLKDLISIDNILSHECRGRIYLEDGISSIYFLVRAIPDFHSQYIAIGHQIIKEIENSKEISRLNSNDAYLKNHFGIFNGYCGVALAMLLIKKEISGK